MKEYLQRKEPEEVEKSERNLTNIINEYKEMFYLNNEFTGTDRAINRYLLYLLWEFGRIGAFNISGVTIFGNISPERYDYKGDVKVTRCVLPMLKDNENMKFTLNTYDIGKNALIGYYNNTKMSVKDFLEPYCKKIAQIDDAIEVNRNQQKAPYIIPHTLKNKGVLNKIKHSMSNNEYIIDLPLASEELKDFKAVSIKQEYLIDKLQAQREKYDNKIKTLLGINNVNFEKKERLVAGEVDANNEEVDLFKNSRDKNIVEFCEECNSLFGTTLEFNKFKEVQEQEQEEELEDDSDIEDDE